MEITDLDAVVPEPKRVKLGGVEYDVPADMPMAIFLRINQAAAIKDEAGEPDQAGQLVALVSVMGDLFGFELVERGQHDEARAASEAVQAILMRRSVEFSFKLARSIYKADDEAAEGATDGPPAQVPEAGDSNGTRSLNTSPNPTIPTVIPAQAAS